MPQFQKGMQRPPGSGRKKGQVSDRTKLARLGVKNAIDICRTGGDDPISIMMNASRFLNSVAAAFAPRQSEGVDLRTVIRATPEKDLLFTKDFLIAAANIAHKAAEFGYAKLQRVDWVGDAPQLAAPENKVIVMLRIGDEDPRSRIAEREAERDEEEDGGQTIDGEVEEIGSVPPPFPGGEPLDDDDGDDDDDDDDEDDDYDPADDDDDE